MTTVEGASGVAWPWWSPSEHNEQLIRLRFLSPLRIRVRGKVLRDPQFPEIVRALLRRLHVLGTLYGGLHLQQKWTLPLLEQSNAVLPIYSDWHYVKEQRYSGRQQSNKMLDGSFGEIAMAGELATLLPFLDAGQWTGIGASTGRGFGTYVLETGVACSELNPGG